MDNLISKLKAFNKVSATKRKYLGLCMVNGSASNSATVVSFDGTLEYRVGELGVWRTASSNQALGVGWQVRTSWGSTAVIKLTTGSTYRMRQLSTIEIQPRPASSSSTVLSLRWTSPYFGSGPSNGLNYKTVAAGTRG